MDSTEIRTLRKSKQHKFLKEQRKNQTVVPPVEKSESASSYTIFFALKLKKKILLNAKDLLSSPKVNFIFYCFPLGSLGDIIKPLRKKQQWPDILTH